MTEPQPVTILIGALGGEGGGVLADWLTRAAELCGYPVQRTSIPGVAQRTGATTYYLEVVPRTSERPGDNEWVPALAPVPGRIDLLVASELMEAGRAVQGGFANPECTTVIASDHRIFTVVEKSGMADGRFSDVHLRDALERFAKRTILFDMDAPARAAGTAISAVMLGAVAASGVLPITRATFESAIRSLGKGVEASLAGFAAGVAAAAPHEVPATVTPVTEAPASNPGVSAVERFPERVRPLVARGYARQLDYQNRKYADLYLERVADVCAAERRHGGAGEFPVTAAVARFLALWMSYEDVIRVADLKTRPARLERVRTDVGAKADEPVRVVEYLKPGIEEWCAILPPRLARRFRRLAERRGWRLSPGLHVHTTSLHGFLPLRLLAGLRWWRPYTARYADEQALIGRWLDAVRGALDADPRLALEIALCGRLIKGYGDTQARAKANFQDILATLSQPLAEGATDRAAAIREAREAALADPEGKTLQRALSARGLAPAGTGTNPAPIVWRESTRAPAAGDGSAP